jgi:hypothetical protein
VLDPLRHTAGLPERLLGESPVHAPYTAAVGPRERAAKNLSVIMHDTDAATS